MEKPISKELEALLWQAEKAIPESRWLLSPMYLLIRKTWRVAQAHRDKEWREALGRLESEYDSDDFHKTYPMLMRDEALALFPRTCTRCDSPATMQTANGKYQERIEALPQNHGYFCDPCYKKGLELEEEAMYAE